MMPPDAEFPALAAELARAADAVRAEAPVSLDTLTRTVARLKAAWAAACSEALAEGVEQVAHDRIDIAGLRVEVAAAQERRRRGDAIGRIARFLALVHRSSVGFEPLEAFPARVREAVLAIEAGADIAATLHPFQAAETLIERWNALSDDQAEELHATVMAAFGTKFAVAAARGRLCFVAGQPAAAQVPLPRTRTAPPPPTAAQPAPAPVARNQEPTPAAADPVAASGPAAEGRNRSAPPAPPVPREKPVVGVEPDPVPVQTVSHRPTEPAAPAPARPAEPTPSPAEPAAALPTAEERPARKAPEPSRAPAEPPPAPPEPPPAPPAPPPAPPEPPAPPPAPPPPPEPPPAPPPAPATAPPAPEPPPKPKAKPASPPVAKPEPARAPPPPPPAPPAIPEPPPPPAPPAPPEPAPLPETVECRLFDGFFPSFIDRIHALHLSMGGLRGIRDAIAGGTADLGPLAALAGDDALRRQALAMIDAWEMARHRGDAETPRGVQSLFALLGSSEAMVREYAKPPPNAVDWTLGLDCGTIDDHDVVAIPHFGSQARGRYRIVLAWERLSFQHMLRRITASLTDEGRPVMILCFRAVDRAERLAFARHTATDAASSAMLLVDELLLLFLMQLPGDRLKALFSCTLPFTGLDPYAFPATALPSELFLGRRAALTSISAADGSGIHLVFGGRRMGKTALLQRVVGDWSIDTRYSAGVYLDIARLGGPAGAPPSMLGGMLAERLDAAGLPVRRNDSYAQMEGRLGDWLNEPRGLGRRRVVIALDNVDALLATDGAAGWREMAHLKTLVQRSGRLIRIVFAGSQTVRRLAHDPKSPFAGMANAIILGPVLGAEDDGEAVRAIRQPLETLGFRFPDRDGIDRLIRHAGADPGHLPPLCSRLLMVARQRALRQRFPSVPVLFVAEDFELACSCFDFGPELAAALQQTLDLDRRWAVVTLLLAGAAQDGAEPAGVPLATLRERACADWPAGFQGAEQPEAFRALLDEMVDFGLARQADSDRYALRDDRVRRALGDAATIETRYRAACA